MTETTWQPVTVRLADLTPWERNPKRISKSHAGRLLDLWQRLGQFQTIAIGPAGEVYDGHQRLSVLKAAHGGKYEVQALQSSRALTEQEREELTIAAHSGTTGTWDWDDLSGWDADNLQAWGLDADALANWQADIGALGAMLASEEEPPQDDPGAQIDRAEELRELWGVQPGQLWQLGEHRLICGDCTDREVVARVMGGEKAGLIVTDPPYGVDYEGGAGNDKKREKLQGDKAADLYLPFLRAAPMDADCAVYLWHADREAEPVYAAIRGAGLRVRAQIIWNKLDAHYGAYMAQYKQKHEPCLYAVRGTPDFCGATNEVTVWDVKQPSRNEYHPTEKPTELIERAISNHPYKLVFDGFLGSGTTLIACQKLGRRARCIEIEPGYVAVCLERWHVMTGVEPVLLP